MPGCFRPKPKAFSGPGKQIIIATLHQGHVAGSTSREKEKLNIIYLSLGSLQAKF